MPQSALPRLSGDCQRRCLHCWARALSLCAALGSVELHDLEKLGKKRINRNDRRRVLLTVTPKGRRLLDDLVSVQAPVNDALFDCLSAVEFQQLSSMMERLVPCGDQAAMRIGSLPRRASLLS